jgi:hypothetical protein
MARKRRTTPRSPTLRDLRRDLRIVDLAALALHPPNFDRCLDLRRAQARATGPARGRRRGSAAWWRRWARSPEGRRILGARPEGFVDRPAVEATAVGAVAAAILVGDSRCEPVAARLLGGALATVLREADDPELEEARSLLMSALALGTAVVHRAGLRDAAWPQHAARRVHVPPPEKLAVLRRAVWFGAAELELLPGRSALATLVRGPGRPGPLVAVGNALIVADPPDLVAAALRRAWQRVSATGHATRIRDAVVAAWRAELVSLAELCDWRVRAEDDPSVLDVELDRGTHARIALLVEPLGGTEDAAWATDVQHNLGWSTRLFTIFAVLPFGRRAALAFDDTIEEHFTWALDALGLQYLLDAGRLDPLALVRCHRWLPAPVPARATDELLDVYGAVRHAEETAEWLDHDRGDPTELTVLIARENAFRHLERGWRDPEEALEVIRFRGSEDPRLLVPGAPDDHLRVVVVDGSATVWISTGATVEDPWCAEPVLVQMLAMWCARLADVHWLGAADDGPGWMSMVVDYDHGHPREVDVEVSLGRPVWRFGQGFLRVLARGDNDADRLVVAALIDLLYRLDTDEDRALHARLVDIVAPKGPGTFLLWNDPARDRVPAPAPALPRTSAADRLMVRGRMAEAARETGQIGVFGGQEAKRHLDLGVEALLMTLLEEVTRCEPALTAALVDLSDRAAAEAERESVRHPARHALGTLPAGPDRAQELVHAPALSRVGIRFLVELAHAVRPHGEVLVNLERLLRLRALAEGVLDYASLSDSVHSGLLDVEVLVGRSGPFAIRIAGPAHDARTKQFDVVLDDAPEAMLRLNPAWWQAGDVPEEPDLAGPVPLHGPWAALSEAMEHDLGFSFDALLRVTRALANHALDEGEHAISAREDAVRIAVAATGCAPATCDAVLAFLVLGRPAYYNPRRHPYKPWKTGRDTGYLRRPILELDDGKLL